MTRPTVYLRRERFDGVTKVVIYSGLNEYSKVIGVWGPQSGSMPNRRRKTIVINGYRYNC